jgi:hypothetical protein
MAGRPHPVVVAGLPVVLVVSTMLGCIGTCVGFPCVSTGIRYGMWVERCPSTDLRLDVRVDVSGVLRGHESGGIQIMPRARWLEGDGAYPSERSADMRRGFSWEVTLKDDAGKPVEGLDLGRGRRRGGVWIPATLPEKLPDGDYTVEVKVDAGFETTTVEVPLPVYAPAVVHLMTDRPLYKPGQEVLLRSVALRRTDLQPLPGRPGKWRIVDPNGDELLVERDRASDWGVAAGSFPLDAEAAQGTWTAQWVTGDSSDTVQFEVRPFRLPRTEVEAKSSLPWFRVGDELVVEGRAKYTSGAPMGNAQVQVALQPVSGRWPMPLSWEKPAETRTAPDGSYRVNFGMVPPDLMDHTTLSAVVSVVDASGEHARGQTALVLSKDALVVQAVTELGGGLVEGFNNRAYLRVTSPDGEPLADTELRVSRPYDPTDPGKQVMTDVDGVAALQIDPGAPVTVVEPAPPMRPRPMVRGVPAFGGQELTGSRSLDLEERRALDALIPQVDRCSDRVSRRAGHQQETRVVLGVQVSAAGTVSKVAGERNAAERCVGEAMRQLRLPAGSLRTYALEWTLPPSPIPYLSWSEAHATGSTSVLDVMHEASGNAARCFEVGQGISGAEVFEVHFAVREGTRAIAADIETMPGNGLSPAAISCARAALGGLSLPADAVGDVMGVATGRLVVPEPPGSAVPQPLVHTGYELWVSAGQDGDPEGGRVVFDVGSIPSLRLRAEPSLAKPGDEVAVELIRGPGFYGELPAELDLMQGSVKVAEAKVVDKVARFRLPDDDTRGFLQVDWGGARSVIFVQPKDPLTVAVSTDQPSYRPGDTARLVVTTRAGAAPTPASVGLVGVDNALGQLAPLVGPNDFGRVTVRAQASRPAFGAFDPRALVLGQVRGENAAKAAVLAIDQLPVDPAGDQPSYGSGAYTSDTVERQSRNFYRALERATSHLRAWEDSAKEGEQLAPEKMVEIWERALGDLRAQGEPAVDGFGRELTLEVLPDDLLALTDPRTLIADGARLPEDFVGWIQYVQQEVR